MIDRRNLLKYFGTGALVAPIIGQAADESHVARLIEPARVEGVELFSNIPAIIKAQEVKTVTLLFTMHDGTSHRMQLGLRNALGVIEPSSTVVDVYFRDIDGPVPPDAWITARRR